MKRILCILSCMNAGGAETFLMKIYRNIDRERYQMDFCINVNEKCFYEDEILSLGGKIYRIPTKSENVTEFKKQLFSVVKNGGYKNVLRITSNAAGFLDLKIAKKAGAEVCIARSSNSSDGKSIKSRVVHKVGRLLYGKFVDIKIAPSDLAAKYTFGTKSYRHGDVAIVHNGIDLSIYKYDVTAGFDIRSELRIPEDAFVVGHIGRFENQKNHNFLIDIFAEIKKKKENAVLLLIGDGSLKEKISAKVIKLGLTDSVIFAGVRKDMPECLSAMDVFVFPSLYEGMPNTVIEAQATGLPCIIADTITKEADLSGLVTYLPLASTVDEWSEKALNAVNDRREEANEKLFEKGYDISSTVEAFTSLLKD